MGTWVKDRHGGTHYRRSDGWSSAPEGFYAFGVWEDMWQGRGPLVECGPWGAEKGSELHAGQTADKATS